ncbi:hypothetical protein ACIQUM_31850 [Amycolatopsis azurea]|uniref:DUF7192 family protein n=1 Tax=Amycolatopsis azurea TaxID=36819 RepID=UPI00382A3B90
MKAYRLAPMRSWDAFLATASAPDTIVNGSGRRTRGSWAGATWDEAIRLAVDGWTHAVPDVAVTVAEPRGRASDDLATTTLAPVWDVTGSEVDIGAFLSGVPECMVDATPQRISAKGRVVTFLIPAAYASSVPHDWIRNRGAALATLCSAIVRAGHSVEIWCGFAVHLRNVRYTAVARVLTPGEPLDLGRLLFAVAHPAMLRRLWFGIWDSAERRVAQSLRDNAYGRPPYTCHEDDLPDDVTDPYVFPYLDENDRQWESMDSALSWCTRTFAGLDLIIEGHTRV